MRRPSRSVYRVTVLLESASQIGKFISCLIMSCRPHPPLSGLELLIRGGADHVLISSLSGSCRLFIGLRDLHEGRLVSSAI